MESPEVEKAFGSGLIAARFRYEDGQVIHVTGHFFTQPGQQQPENVVAAGRGFTTFSQNVTRAKEADAPRIDTLYSSGARREVQLQAAPTPASGPAPTMGRASGSNVGAGEKLKPLEKKGDFTRVRDQQGNEGWVPNDAL